MAKPFIIAIDADALAIVRLRNPQDGAQANPIVLDVANQISYLLHYFIEGKFDLSLIKIVILSKPGFYQADSELGQVIRVQPRPLEGPYNFPEQFIRDRILNHLSANLTLAAKLKEAPPPTPLAAENLSLHFCQCAQTDTGHLIFNRKAILQSTTPKGATADKSTRILLLTNSTALIENTFPEKGKAPHKTTYVLSGIDGEILPASSLDFERRLANLSDYSAVHNVVDIDGTALDRTSTECRDRTTLFSQVPNRLEKVKSECDEKGIACHCDFLTSRLDPYKTLAADIDVITGLLGKLGDNYAELKSKVTQLLAYITIPDELTNYQEYTIDSDNFTKAIAEIDALLAPQAGSKQTNEGAAALPELKTCLDKMRLIPGTLTEKYSIKAVRDVLDQEHDIPIAPKPSHFVNYPDPTKRTPLKYLHIQMLVDKLMAQHMSSSSGASVGKAEVTEPVKKSLIVLYEDNPAEIALIKKHVKLPSAGSVELCIVQVRCSTDFDGDYKKTLEDLTVYLRFDASSAARCLRVKPKAKFEAPLPPKSVAAFVTEVMAAPERKAAGVAGTASGDTGAPPEEFMFSP